MHRRELAAVPGVPEAAVSPALLDRLPAQVPPAPWEVTCEAVVWAHRAGPAAREALPPALRGSRPLLVVGALVRYADTPVGAYDEVLGVVLSRTGARPWGSVAFIAVDLAASLAAGRANWGMPKSLAAFEGRLESAFSATGEEADWRVGAAAAAAGPRLPVAARLVARQQLAGGAVVASRLAGRARVRPALVTVEVRSAGPLAGWLRPGRHAGAVLDGARFHLGAPRAVPR